MRLSRSRIREFLHNWPSISLSVGSINKFIHESGRAALPLENELVKEILNSNVLHVDESVPRRRTGGEIPPCSHAAQEMRVRNPDLWDFNLTPL